MNYDQKKTAGILLCMMGFWFYCQNSLDVGYLNATRNDFAHLYLAGFLAERGGDFFNDKLLLYTHKYLNIPSGLNPFVYPPFFAILLIPLSYFSYENAWLLFTLLSHAAYFASLGFLVRLMRQEDEPVLFLWGILIALSACFYPLMKTYSAGQMNTFMLLVISWSAYLLSRNRQIETGLVLGLGTAVKLAPGFLLLYCLWTRRWRAFISGLSVIFVTIYISVYYLGFDIHGGFLSMVKEMGYGSSTWSKYLQTYHVDPFNQSPSAMWYHLFSTTQTNSFGALSGIANLPLLAKILSYMTALSILGLLGYVTKRGKKTFSLIEYSLWSIGMLLIPSLLWDHYLVQAILAIIVAVQLAFFRSMRGIWILGLAITILAVPFLHHLPLFHQGGWTLFMSFKLFGLLLLLVYLVMHRNEEFMVFPHD